MYEESATFDPNPIPGLPEDGFSDTHIPNCAAVEEPLYHHHHHSAAAAMDVENIQHQLNMQIDNCCYNNNNPTGAAATAAHHHHTEVETQPNWETAVHSLPEMGFYNHHHQQDQHHHFQQQNYTSSSLPETPYPTTPDLLNLFHLPRTSAASLLPNSSISFTNPNPGQNLLYDPLLPLNLPPHPPSFRDLFQSLPHNYGLPGSRGSGTLFGGLEEREENGILYQGGGGGGDMREYDSGLLEFTREMNCIVKGRNGKDTKHFATEKQRREHLNGKYHTLRSLVPNPTKPDRASVVGDAIEYIKELLRTVNELKILVEKKRCARERIKRQKIHDDGSGDPSDVAASATAKPPNSGEHGGDQQLFDGSSSLRSSWLQRKSKNSEIDVRIIHDEVTIKLAQQKRINCLLPVSKVLDELQLDLHHVAGGLVGNYYSFLFNTKICEGSSVYASAIANRLIDAVERQYAAVPTTSSY